MYCKWKFMSRCKACNVLTASSWNGFEEGFTLSLASETFKDCSRQEACVKQSTNACACCNENINNINDPYKLMKVSFRKKRSLLRKFCVVLPKLQFPMHKPIPDWRKKKKSYFDRQEGGNHYDNKYDVAKFCIANDYGCAESAIIKYAARHERKNGAEDIKKIIHYAQFILEVKYGQGPE